MGAGPDGGVGGADSKSDMWGLGNEPDLGKSRPTRFPSPISILSISSWTYVEQRGGSIGPEAEHSEKAKNIEKKD